MATSRASMPRECEPTFPANRLLQEKKGQPDNSRKYSVMLLGPVVNKSGVVHLIQEIYMGCGD
jgi:hypothetical protein